MTNYDFIKTKSIEEIAELLDGTCGCCVHQNACGDGDCIHGIISWLKKEHINAMPELLPGDNLLIDSGPYGMCNFIYIGDGKIFREYTGLINIEVAGKIVTVSRFNGAGFEKIWEED